MPSIALGCTMANRVARTAAPQIPHNRLEHRLQIEGRAADDLEHRRSRSAAQRYGEIVGALAQLVEQARVLDGDDSLGGEILHQLDLLVGERADFLAIDDRLRRSVRRP